VTSPYAAQQGQWYGVGVSYAAAENVLTLTVATDGVAPATLVQTLTKAPAAAGGVLRLGGTWAGDVDEVSTYAVALSAEAVRALLTDS
jgi:hypothetical protein